MFDPLEAIKPGAPLLHPDLKSYEVVPYVFPRAGTNVSNVFRVRKGDTEAAWSRCDAIVEGTYRVPHIQHVPIEPHVAVARWEHSGEVTLWSSTQSPFAQRDLIAQTLGISQGDMRVIGSYIGGGFGSKAGVSMEALAVAMAQKVPGRPVKLRMTREEEFFCTFVRQGLIAKVKIGGTRAGKILALPVEYYGDAGANTEYGVNITRASGYSSTGPYNVPNVKTDSYCLYTTTSAGRCAAACRIHWISSVGRPPGRKAGPGSGRVPPQQLRERWRHDRHRHDHASHRAVRVHRQGGQRDRVGDGENPAGPPQTAGQGDRHLLEGAGHAAQRRLGSLGAL